MKGKPNAGHYAISKFLEFCSNKENGVESMLVTQNIDDYHE